MSESRLLPSDLMGGSRLLNSLPDQKLVVYHIWASATNDAGCFEPDLARWGGHLSLTIDSLKLALKWLEKTGIISCDDETNEIFINDWFRIHKFEGMRKNMLKRAINNIKSPNLRQLVMAKKEEVDILGCGGMSESRLMPANLLSGWRVRNLLPDQKLIIYHLWATATNDAGCYEPDLAGWSGHLSLTIDSLILALSDFEKIGIISIDGETNEIFINDWFRFHKFEGIRKNMLIKGINKIESQNLKMLVLHKKEELEIKNGVIPLKTTSCATKERKLNKTKSSCIPQEEVPNLRTKKCMICGVTCWTSADRAATEKLVEDFGAESVKKAAAELARKGQEPFPSRVLYILTGESNAKTNYNTSNDEIADELAKRLGIPRGCAAVTI